MDTARGRNVRVMMTYADALERLAAWFVQLWAESLGKDGKGSTPHGAVGTTDQHSQVQLYMQGPQDKAIEIVEVENHPRDLQIPGAYKDLAGVGYLGGHTMAELLNVECDATRRALTEAGRPNCTIRLDEPNEENLGYLLQALEVQTAIAGALRRQRLRPARRRSRKADHIQEDGQARILEHLSTRPVGRLSARRLQGALSARFGP